MLGLPLLIVSAQMVYGSKRAWLPRVLVDRTDFGRDVPLGHGAASSRG